jgi:hypothetical protein
MMEALKDFDYTNSKLEFIKRLLIEEHFPPHAFQKTSRKLYLVDARAWFAWLVRERFGNSISLSQIGAFLGGYDHSNILHLQKKKSDEIECYRAAKRVAEKLIERSKMYVNVERSLKEKKKHFNEEVSMWLLEVNKKLITFSEQIQQDAVMEGWRRHQMLKDLSLLKEELNKIIQISKDAEDSAREAIQAPRPQLLD